MLLTFLSRLAVVSAFLGSTVANAQTQQLTPEFQLGATLGGGWYDAGVRSYETGDTSVANGNGMEVSFGAVTRAGVVIRPGVGLMLLLQGSLLSAATAQQRFLLGAVSGMFGVRVPVLADRTAVLIAGVLGIGFAHNTTADGSGVTYGALMQYRVSHIFVEARYQRWVFDGDAGAPQLDADLWIHQILMSAGLVL